MVHREDRDTEDESLQKMSKMKNEIKLKPVPAKALHGWVLTCPHIDVQYKGHAFARKRKKAGNPTEVLLARFCKVQTIMALPVYLLLLLR